MILEKEFGVTSLPLYWVCRVFGHKLVNVGDPIIHNATEELPALIEQDQDCSRCGMQGTSVIPKKTND